MKKGKSDSRLDKLDGFMSLNKLRSVQILASICVLYILLVTLELPLVSKIGLSNLSQETLSRLYELHSEEDLQDKHPQFRVNRMIFRNSNQPTVSRQLEVRGSNGFLSGLTFDPHTFDPGKKDGPVELHKAVKTAWEVGRKVWADMVSGPTLVDGDIHRPENKSQQCPHSVLLSGTHLVDHGRAVELPCGLTLGSHITLVGKPRAAHAEKDPKIHLVREGEEVIMVSQFMMELQGLKTVEGEDPPRILHFNPRLKGDWSGKPVIEQNTCYRMQWGSALRCEGWKSKDDEETVDGHVKCEKWVHDDDSSHMESTASWWLNRLMGRARKVTFDWPFPFSEDKLFVLTLAAGLEGYHISVDGRHITSFPYRTGFALEDATGLIVKGDIDVHSMFAASLPTSHPSFDPQRHLELSTLWKAPVMPEGVVQLFIGILSTANHFAERMAVRKSWMQHKLIKSSNIVARFFVALHARKEVNLALRREAEFFQDVIIVPYMDNYDLVVLKTVAIFEYGSRTMNSNHIMKCDDDTFIRVDAVMAEVARMDPHGDFYIGNINYYHRPLRYGKWAVTHEEWPEEEYPPYANGPGYIISSGIARFIVTQFEAHNLRLFKMEDVSVGMWVEQFNSTRPVRYVHSLRFCQFGCIEGYYTAHYQSPRQMICLWENLQKLGRPHCCNFR